MNIMGTGAEDLLFSQQSHPTYDQLLLQRSITLVSLCRELD